MFRAEKRKVIIRAGMIVDYFEFGPHSFGNATGGDENEIELVPMEKFTSATYKKFLFK